MTSADVILNQSGNTTPVAQTAVTEAAEPKTKDWFPSQHQVTVVATILWNVAAAGFALNTILLVRYLKVKWYLLPLPPPTIAVNLCVSNLLLLLGVLLATLTLTFDLGETGVYAGRVHLFLSVCVLLQSWLGQVMLSFCGSWARQQSHQGRSGSLESGQSLVDRCESRSRQERAYTTGSISMSRWRPVYQPCRRHSHLSQTTSKGNSSERAPLSCCGEAFSAGPKLALTAQQNDTVKWWLVWAWLLTMLAASALLMTTTDDQNVCKTLDPFQRRYQIAGDDISQVSYSENSLLKIPLLLVLLPVYLVGAGVIIRPAFIRAQSQIHRGLSSCQSDQTRRDNAQKERRLRGQNIEVSFKSRGELSTCNINLNAVKGKRSQKLQQRAYTEDISQSDQNEHPKTGTEQEDVPPDDRNKNAVFSPTTDIQQDTLKTGKVTSLEGEATELEKDWSGSGISGDERDAAYLLFVDDDTGAKPIDKTPQSCQQPRKSSAQEQVLAFDDTIDLSLFELDEYVVHFNDTVLASNLPVRRVSEVSLLSDISRQQAAIHSQELPQRSDDLCYECDHRDHRPVIVNIEERLMDGGSEVEQNDVFLGGIKPNGEALLEESGKNTDTNNHANKRRVKGGETMREVASDQCRKNKTQMVDPDTDSLSSGGNSNIFSNRYSKLHTTLSSTASGPSGPALTHPPWREESGVRQQQLHESSRPTDGQNTDGAGGLGSGGAGQLGITPPPKTVSSSTHHFTVQERPPPTGHFQLYPPRYLSQNRLHLQPHPETQPRHQQVFMSAAARSRLSSDVSALRCPRASRLQGVRRPLDKADPEDVQMSDTDRDEQTQSSDPNLQEPFEQHARDCPAREAKQAPSQSQGNRHRNLSLENTAASIASKAPPEPASSDDVLWHDPWDQRRQVSFSDQPPMAATSCYHESLCNAASRQASSPLNDPQSLPSDDVTAFGNGSKPTANSARSLRSKTFHPFASAAAERGQDNVSGLSSGDTTESAFEAKRAGQAKKRRSTRGSFSCYDVSYGAKCLAGLVMHVLLCLPLAVVLAPGVWLGADCGSRLQTLLVVRLLMFCHVVICPLWLLSFHCDTDILKIR